MANLGCFLTYCDGTKGFNTGKSKIILTPESSFLKKIEDVKFLNISNFPVIGPLPYELR